MDFASMLVTAVVAGVRAYLGSFLKKKSENWATRKIFKNWQKHREGKLVLA